MLVYIRSVATSSESFLTLNVVDAHFLEASEARLWKVCVHSYCYPSRDLSVGVFPVVNSKDVEHLLLLVHNIENPELANSVPPGFRGVPLKLLDVLAPEGLRLELGIDKCIKLAPQEAGVA